MRRLGLLLLVAAAACAHRRGRDDCVPQTRSLATAVGATEVYAGHGLSLRHPAGWEVEEEHMAEERVAIDIIYMHPAPGSLVAVQVFRPAVHIDLERQRLAVVEGIRSGAERSLVDRFGHRASGPLKVSGHPGPPLCRAIMGRPSPGQRAFYEFSLGPFQLGYTVDVYVAEAGELSILVFAGVAADEVPAVVPGLHLVLETLRVGIQPPDPRRMAQGTKTEPSEERFAPSVRL